MPWWLAILGGGAVSSPSSNATATTALQCCQRHAPKVLGIGLPSRLNLPSFDAFRCVGGRRTDDGDDDDGGAPNAGHGHGAFPPTPGRIYTFGAKAMGAVMWFWILYRAKEDGPALLVSEGAGTAPGARGRAAAAEARTRGARECVQFFPRLTLLPMCALLAAFAGFPAPVGAPRPRAPGERQVALRAAGPPCACGHRNETYIVYKSEQHYTALLKHRPHAPGIGRAHGANGCRAWQPWTSST